LAQNLFDTCVDANSLMAGIEKEEQLITRIPTPTNVLKLLPVFVCMAQNLFDTCVDANSLVAGIEKEEQLITRTQAAATSTCSSCALIHELFSTTVACTNTKLRNVSPARVCLYGAEPV
jgi:hypothetical protein